MKGRPFHPLLFAAFPVLALYSENTALIPWTDVTIPLGIVVAGTCVFWGLLTLVLRDASRAAVGASVGVVVFFAEGHLWDFVKLNATLAHTYDTQQGLFVPWLILWVFCVLFACWKWRPREQLTGAMNLAGICLAGFPLLSIGMSWFSFWRGTAVEQVASGAAKLDTSVRPDIYYLILDGYGRTDAVKRAVGLDNAWFIKALEDRGFYLPSNAHSNYCETELSLSSSLNMDYLPNILPNMNRDWTDRSILDRLMDKSAVSRYLKKVGYRYEALTTGFPAIHPYSADLWLQDTRGVSLFAGQLVAETPIPADTSLGGVSQFVSRRTMLRSALENMGNNAGSGSQPRFIFVHVLAPHPPFVFGPNGEPRRPKGMGFMLVNGNHFYQNGGTPEEYATGYREQATYISKLVLAAVDKILKRSHLPPVIIIQGDHGSKMRLDQEDADKTDVNECFPNLNAFYVPAKVRAKLYDGLTPVNSFRLLFDGLFGDDLKQLPDHSYFSPWSWPFRFTEVTNRIKPAPVSAVGR